MADPNWRTNPDIQLAKHVCQQQKARAAIIVWFMDGGRYGTASYGQDGELCRAAGKVADSIVSCFQEEYIADPLTEILG